MLRPTHLVVVLAVVAVAVSLTGCGGERAGRMAPAPAAQPGQDADGAKPDPAGAKQNPEGARKIIYTATLRVQVEDFAKASAALAKLIEANQGLVAQSEVRGTAGAPRSGEWKVRVPVARLEAFRAAVAALGEAETNRLDSQDVTEELYDLKTRIKNREVDEVALRKLYDQAKKMDEILAVRKELSALRLEIEREQGRLQLLTKLTDLTTVNVSLFERTAHNPEGSPSLGTRVDRTFGDSVGGLQRFGEGVVLFAVVLAPWLPVLAAVGVPVWLLVRRHRRRSASVAQRP